MGHCDDSGCVISGIKCDVSNCMYHTTTNCCAANGIEVGNGDACKCSETACMTFEKKD